eukprot:1497670-Amphidinium_carterae.1
MIANRPWSITDPIWNWLHGGRRTSSSGNGEYMLISLACCWESWIMKSVLASLSPRKRFTTSSFFVVLVNDQ